MAYFLCGGLARGEGRGERVTALGPSPDLWSTLFLPDFGCSTPAVYAEARVPTPSERRSPEPLLGALGRGAPVEEIAVHLHNRLEEAAVRAAPRVAEVRALLAPALAPGERLMLSGSGSAFFALSASRSRALAVAERWNHLGGGRAVAVKMAPAS